MSNIYTFIDDDGKNIHIDSVALREWCMKTKPEIFLLPMNYKVAKDFYHDNVISVARVKELMKRDHLDPIIMVKDGTTGKNGYPNAMLVDGHHRYYLAYKQGKKFIEGYFLELFQWKPFQLHGLPSITKDQLRDVPITKRDY